MTPREKRTPASTYPLGFSGKTIPGGSDSRQQGQWRCSSSDSGGVENNSVIYSLQPCAVPGRVPRGPCRANPIGTCLPVISLAALAVTSP